MGKRLSFQQKLKRSNKQCQICKESNYEVLDVHRIVPGSTGGKYEKKNTVCVCCKCHRRIHAGEIVIDGYYHSTSGIVLHYFEGDKEFWQ